MDVCGRVAAIFKILPVLVSFHGGACCAGRKHPPTEKNPPANLHSPPACRVGKGWAPPQALQGMHSATSEAPLPTIRPAPPPGFQPLTFCGVEGFFFLFFLVSFFLVLLGPWPWRKGAPGSLPPLSPLPPATSQRGKESACQPLWVVGLFVVLFCWWRWWPSSILDLQNPPENLGKESPSCSQLLCLVGLAPPPPTSRSRYVESVLGSAF